MSQFDDPRLDEVKRVLRRVQDIGEQLADPPPRAGSLPRSQQRPGTLSAALSAARHQPEDPMPPPQPPFAVERAMRNAVGEQRVQPWHNFGIMFAVAVVSASAGVLTVFLTIASISRQAANPSRPETAPNVVMALRPDSSGPSPAASAQEDRKEALYTALASTPRLVAPAEWPAPAGVATNLPLSVEPPEEAATHHVLVSGLEASAFVIKGTELIEGTWIVPAGELASAKVVRNANAPGRTSLTLELRTDAGAVVNRAQVILLAPALAAGFAGASANR